MDRDSSVVGGQCYRGECGAPVIVVVGCPDGGRPHVRLRRGFVSAEGSVTGDTWVDAALVDAATGLEGGVGA